MSYNIYVIGPKDKNFPPAKVINVTSRAKSPFSPFFHGTSEPLKSIRMENAWQFSKVYPEHDRNGHPTKAWFDWHQRGLQDKWAHRYPMGKGAVPLYTWFKGQKLDYVEARKQLYIPLYLNMLSHIPDAINELVQLAQTTDIALWDFDGYFDPNRSFDDVVNDPNHKMGHAFVLKQVVMERLNNVAV